jgi:hypothetical protein
MASKCPLTIRLLELLHTQPAIWIPYKELCPPERIQTGNTLTSNELRQFLKKLPITLSLSDFMLWELMRSSSQDVFADCIKVISQLLSLVLPTGVDIDPTEITWAFNVVETRSVLTEEAHNRGSNTNQIVPLFDMLNHASGNTCSFAPRDARRKCALQADPARLSVVIGPDGAELLMRDGRPLGRLDDCIVVRASSSGLRAGEEARFEYHDTASLRPMERIMFSLTYGFYPV